MSTARSKRKPKPSPKARALALKLMELWAQAQPKKSHTFGQFQVDGIRVRAWGFHRQPQSGMSELDPFPPLYWCEK